MLDWPPFGGLDAVVNREISLRTGVSARIPVRLNSEHGWWVAVETASSLRNLTVISHHSPLPYINNALVMRLHLTSHFTDVTLSIGKGAMMPNSLDINRFLVLCHNAYLWLLWYFIPTATQTDIGENQNLGQESHYSCTPRSWLLALLLWTLCVGEERGGYGTRVGKLNGMALWCQRQTLRCYFVCELNRSPHSGRRLR